MKRLADHLPDLGRRLRPEVVYADLDGTLFGPGGSLFADAGGRVTTRPAEAMAALHRAGVALVPVSGRTREQVRETARILGAPDFICELGALTCYKHDSEVVRAHGEYRGSATPYEAMARSGAAALLLEAFPGRLEPHAPWAFAGRESTMLFRGHIDLGAARKLLEDAGHGWLDVHDNGVIARRYPGLATEVHAYHLVPKGVSKAAAIASDATRRQLPREACVAVGDSASDVAAAPSVGAVFVVANGVAAVEAAGPTPDNAYATDGAYGQGFAEAVLALLGA